MNIDLPPSRNRVIIAILVIVIVAWAVGMMLIMQAGGSG